MTTLVFWLVFAALLALMCIALAVAFIWALMLGRKQKTRHGFEVKPTTGEVPVNMKEKNNG